MNLLEVLQEVAMYESSLASCAIEGNEFADYHLNKCKDMELIDKYYYLKNVFNGMKNRVNMKD